MNVKQIFENNRNWIAKKLQSDDHYFEKLAKKQKPEFLYIGCSDSRVSTEELMGLQPGQVFVHRNIANMVPNTDLNSMSVINYAVTILKVNHIVVCGHYDCSGVRAAMQQADLGVLNPWLRNIRDVYRIHRKELNAITNDGEKYKRLVELNVQEQCINVIKTAEVQRANRQRNLKVYGWVFDVHTGKLIDLNIDFDAIFNDITKIYKIED
ncbi:MAG TPA: carbonic anhydrase [Flavobacterium sp.]|jgi:carbonic anhydrase|uniref:carbonic anhydrase n=1 Tax=Flavobacterium sp. TaxID=239 RepID=UPI001B508A84|nr:carbonic anhydrase [Flavobacterium sp.]MBP6145775.1 carbonic anhydrase [Flavobacterium sp.]MBP7182482.1 carbonic anhydrase [Flavobacterium sp.]MBP7318653.1 carbonic anhydrase [Flavobacterium sp.]MBP8886578.1 carbonic anhydrase [Flavobacterium sp.]HRL71544.1 carbonic anhydrase [Flavobacterium sp.]